MYIYKQDLTFYNGLLLISDIGIMVRVFAE